MNASYRFICYWNIAIEHPDFSAISIGYDGGIFKSERIGHIAYKDLLSLCVNGEYYNPDGIFFNNTGYSHDKNS